MKQGTEKSYVREMSREIEGIYERPYRKHVMNNQFTVRLPEDEAAIIRQIASKWGCSNTTVVEMILEEAVKDAGEELGLWAPDFEEGEDPRLRHK